MSFVVNGRHVLVGLLAFFAVTVAVNAVFVTYALDTFTGEDVAKPYVTGLAYNETLHERAAQARLGWRATVDLTRTGDGATVEAELSDSTGAPRDGLSVVVALRRPTDAALDRTLPLAESGGGRYAATIPALPPGQWDVIVRTTAPDGTAFEATRRLVLK